MYIRPVRLDDHGAILALARQAGFGMTSLPPDETVLTKKIERAVASFAGEAKPQHESFLFVLVDDESDTIAGTCGIVAHVGLTQPFYSYKRSTLTQFSATLDQVSKQTMLHVVNDYTGATEIGSLFLAPGYRRDRIGMFLSRVRFLFIAEFRHLFDDRLIAEIRGTHDEDGNSPFYSAIAEPFFGMPFRDADYRNATKGNQFISDLMPRYPVYADLLPKEGQRSIGKAHPASEAAMAMLTREGLRYNDYLDIFDGGPTLEARTSEIRSVRESRPARVAAFAQPEPGERCLISTGGIADFRAIAEKVVIEPSEIDDLILPASAAELLGVGLGDTVRYVRG